jgi:hypothetical protein
VIRLTTRLPSTDSVIACVIGDWVCTSAHPRQFGTISKLLLLVISIMLLVIPLIHFHLHIEDTLQYMYDEQVQDYPFVLSPQEATREEERGGGF